MTRDSLRKRITLVIGLCCLLVVLGAMLFYIDTEIFQTFRDFILLLVAIPAALLADYFQKRNNFEDALRVLWSNILNSVNEARQFTYRNSATEDEYRRILVSLSKSIDEMRGVYKNLGESKASLGYYPFESLKIIYELFFSLGFGELDKEKTGEVRKQIEYYWKNFKESFLWEFDRPEPESFNTPYQYKEKTKNNFQAYPLNIKELEGDNQQTTQKR